MRIRLLHIAVLTVIFTGIPIIGSANPLECKDWVARIVSVEGQVEVLLVHGTERKISSLEKIYSVDKEKVEEIKEFLEGV